VLLPHIGSATLATRRRIALMATNGVAAALGGS
jgi:lactate dehydrogenase-like 2-hydroxyacid dehydrogenase